MTSRFVDGSCCAALVSLVGATFLKLGAQCPQVSKSQQPNLKSQLQSKSQGVIITFHIVKYAAASWYV